jgi:hypothetical protein
MLPIKKLNSKGNAKYDTINDVGFEFKNDFLQKGTSSKMSEKDKKKFLKFVREKEKNKVTDSEIKTPEQLEQDQSQYEIYEKKTTMTIDSRHRDKISFPDANHFNINLGTMFNNVVEIKLVSTEIPNSDQVIKNTPYSLKNNKIYWENEEDVDLQFRNNIQVGNYIVADKIVLEIPSHNLHTGDSILLYNSNTTPNVDGNKTVERISDDIIVIYLKNGLSIPGQTSIQLGRPIYSVEIKSGNYTATNLLSEISNKMNLIKRRNGNGEFHYFLVELSTDTDILSFTNLVAKQLSNNPFSTIAGSGILTVTHNNHGFNTGNEVYILGAKQIAGVPSATINGVHIITVIDINTYTYEVNVRAIESAAGGGNTVTSGQNSNFRLLFGDYSDTPVANLGFKRENASQYIGTENPFSTKTFKIDNISLGTNYLDITTSENHNLVSSVKIDIVNITYYSDSKLKILCAVPHGLSIETKITLFDTNVDGDFLVVPFSDTELLVEYTDNFASVSVGGYLYYGGDKIKIFNLISTPAMTKEYYIENAVGQTFRLYDKFIHINMDSLPNSFIGTHHLYVNHPNHSFNTVSSIVQGPSINLVNLVTGAPHNLSGTFFFNKSFETVISNTVDINIPSHGLNTFDKIEIINSYVISPPSLFPPIDGVYYITRLDADNIRITFSGGTPNQGFCDILFGTKVFISQTNCSPKINGYYNINYIDPTTFQIIKNGGLTVSGSSGILGNNLEINFYRITPDISGENSIGGFPIQTIQNRTFSIETIVDQNNYIVRIPDQYSTRKILNKGGSEVYISSNVHGFKGVLSNTIDWLKTGVLNQSITLEGINYIYMLIKGLQSVKTTNFLNNVFAKLLLNEVPGNIVFNSFISSPVRFTQLLSKLNELEISIVDPDGNSFNFNNLDYSFSLEITELYKTDSNANVGSVSKINAFSFKGGNVKSAILQKDTAKGNTSEKTKRGITRNK